MRFLTSVNRDSLHFGQVNILLACFNLCNQLQYFGFPLGGQRQVIDKLKEGEDGAKRCWIGQVTYPVQFEKLIHSTRQAIIQRNGYFVILSNNDVLPGCTL